MADPEETALEQAARTARGESPLAIEERAAAAAELLAQLYIQQVELPTLQAANLKADEEAYDTAPNKTGYIAADDGECTETFPDVKAEPEGDPPRYPIRAQKCKSWRQRIADVNTGIEKMKAQIVAASDEGQGVLDRALEMLSKGETRQQKLAKQERDNPTRPQPTTP